MTLKRAKLEFCSNMASLLEGLDTDVAQEFIKWLDKLHLEPHFEYWQEEEEIIYCMEKPYQEVGD